MNFWENIKKISKEQDEREAKMISSLNVPIKKGDIIITMIAGVIGIYLTKYFGVGFFIFLSIVLVFYWLWRWKKKSK